MTSLTETKMTILTNEAGNIEIWDELEGEQVGYELGELEKGLFEKGDILAVEHMIDCEVSQYQDIQGYCESWMKTFADPYMVNKARLEVFDEKYKEMRRHKSMIVRYEKLLKAIMLKKQGRL